MPPDTEKPIERLLRRYARKRRERAREPWTVHPVTRELLQQEVARQFPKKRSFGSALRELFRPGWLKPVIAVAGAAAVIIIGLIFSPRPGRTDKSITDLPATDSSKLAANDQPASQLIVASGSAHSNQFFVAADNAASPSRALTLREALPSATLAENGPAKEKQEVAPAAPPAMTLAENKKDEAAPIARDSIAPVASTAAAGASSSLAASAPNEPKGSQAVQSADQREANNVASFARGESSVALGKTATDRAKAVMQFGLFNAFQTPVVSPAQQQEAMSRNTQFRSALGVQSQAANARGILTSFNVEQAGRELRVIDSDGSVYAGPVQPTNMQGAVLTQRRGLQDQAASKRGFQSTAIQESEVPPAGSSFQLTGTNKTLNRRVFFNGILTTNQAVAGRVLAQNTGGLAGSANKIQANRQGQSLHLSGTAEIEGEPPVRIEASPASQ